MGKRILFVEEDAGFGRVFTHAMREALGDEGLGVALAEAGFLAKARSRLREGGLDAALIDVRLPDGNGLDLVREIHDGAVIPTLVLTANLDHAVAAQAVEAGAQGAQSKVVSMPETVEAIKRLTEAGPPEGKAPLAARPIDSG